MCIRDSSHLFHQVCTDSDTAKRDPDTVKHDHDTDSDTAKRDPDTVKHDHDTDSDTAKRDPDTVKHDHDTAKSYECIGRAIAAYERSAEVSQFTSKYDYWLKGQAMLTVQEARGLALFSGKAKCANCHVPPNFTDFTYDNLGGPRNPLNPFYSCL